MMKRIISLIVTSSLISAGLLYLGFTILSQYTPAHASSLKALVAETGLQSSAASVSAADSSLSSKESGSEKSDHLDSSSSLVTSRVPQVSSDKLSTGVTPVTGITIAELLKNLGLHDEVIVTITGIATRLDDERFLLNDGTGQIMVEVEDDNLDRIPDINGLSVTVTGKFEASSDSSGPELKATSLTFLGQTFFFGDLSDDDDMDDDDMDDDDMDDDSDEDMDDDNSGSGSDDDLSDDDSGSGSDDDLSDNDSGSGSDDDLSDDDSGSGSSDSSWDEIDD